MGDLHLSIMIGNPWAGELTLLVLQVLLLVVELEALTVLATEGVTFMGEVVLIVLVQELDLEVLLVVQAETFSDKVRVLGVKVHMAVQVQVGTQTASLHS